MPPYSISVFSPAYNDEGTIASLVLAALETLEELTDDYRHVRAIHHPQNRGYGGALQTGFASASKELIFYTDGDAQYDPRELKMLYEHFDEQVDFVNGWKLKRQDPVIRIVLGRLYQYTVKYSFRLKLRDVDCDFRLMRRSIFETVQLESTSGVICDAGFRRREVPVSHYHRLYGKSQFFNYRRLWWKLVIRREHLRDMRPPASAQSRTEKHPPRNDPPV
ncbi:MAG: glycosyltransferase family 2 protein [Anaerolineae bacterium]|nr:MAG: glycosyltransferase family 2 protein [Anaerolineae bacterium]